MKPPWAIVAVAVLATTGCRGADSPAVTTCKQDPDCEPAWICSAAGFCIQGCSGNNDCPDGEVCMAETQTCEQGGGDADADGDTDADADCPDPGTSTCAVPADCAGDDAPCACLDLLAYGGYCYPDCAACEAPHECLEGGCLFVGPLSWEFDLRIIDPDAGGGDYIDLDLDLDAISVTFAYAYAYVDTIYNYVWINF
ncbi:MAG TPA: hypothetical protein VM285_16270, partial [Polyangia bacterium]|nr:hypothetical protein [Polyangia bacterium]